jgi:hypothetical protein
MKYMTANVEEPLKKVFGQGFFSDTTSALPPQNIAG